MVALNSSCLLEDCKGEVIWLSGDGLYLPRRSPLGPSEVEGPESVTGILHNRLGKVAQHILPPYLFSEISQLFAEGHGPRSSFLIAAFQVSGGEEANDVSGA